MSEVRVGVRKAGVRRGVGEWNSLPRLPVERSGTALFLLQWRFPLERRNHPIHVFGLLLLLGFELRRLQDRLVSRPGSALHISASCRRRWQGGPTMEYREYSEEAQRRQRCREPPRYVAIF